jgi:hypothetical protein
LMSVVPSHTEAGGGWIVGQVIIVVANPCGKDSGYS